MELTLRGITKSFGASNVLDKVDLDIRGGEICALLGENGAGKSTLMNIVGGVIAADSGEILLDGKKVSFSSPAESLRSGIAFIHQELNLINPLTVYENLFLSDFPKKGLFLDKQKMRMKTEALFKSLGIAIDPDCKVEALDASYKQIVEIARALLSKASLIIMDEPTTSLNAAEIERIFDVMKRLREQGVAIIFISHKLNEVFRICDRFSVLRNGVVVQSGKISDVTVRKIASYMVGRELKEGIPSVSHETAEEVLKLEHLSDGKHFTDVSLTLHKGEILGVTGLLGDGRSELFGTVFGLFGGGYSGKIYLEGKEIHPSAPYEALKYGLAYLAKKQKENAIIKDMSILDNGTAVTLEDYKKLLLLDKKAQEKAFDAQVEALSIKSSNHEKSITTLSGGNQQKVVLSKWLLSMPKVLILDNPTQGVDVGAKEEIYGIIDELAEQGISVVVLSSEAQEIIRLCKRSLVLFHGEVAGEVTGDDMTEEKMMVLATGAGKEK